MSLLACPHCAADLALDGRSLRCSHGHVFDIARQGHVTLLAGGSPAADTAAMVAARADFLAQGHYQPITDALRLAHTRLPHDGPIVDLGAGPGHYLAALLTEPATSGDDHQPVGLALDLSKYAARRAAKAHPAITAVVCDAWRGLPVRSGVASRVINVFAPRNPAEIARILRPDGRLLVVTPQPDHLRELVTALRLLTVDTDKARRLDDQLSPVLRHRDTRTLTFELSLRPAQVQAVVAMGPNAWHTDAEDLARAVAELPDPLPVTAAVRISEWSPAPSRG